MRSLKRKNITTYGVPLLNDGCYATEVDYNKMIEVMEYFNTWYNILVCVSTSPVSLLRLLYNTYEELT